MPVKIMAMPCSLAAAITSLVFDGAARLNDRLRTGVGCFVKTVAKRIESVRCNGRTLKIQPVGGGAQYRDLGRINATHLPGTDPEDLLRRCEDDRVRL